MSRGSSSVTGGLVASLLIAACGGGGGTEPSGAGPSASERMAMAAALTAAAANAQAANDDQGVFILQAAAAMVQAGLTVTAVSGVTFSREGEMTAATTGAPFVVGNGWAFGVEMGQTQGQPPQTEVGVFEGAVVISGPDIAYGFGLVSQTPGFVGSSFGAIWQGPNAGWVATSLTGIGVADSIVGGSCLGSALAGLGVVDCTAASLSGPGFNITASMPLGFPGNTAAGSNTMAFGPARLRGAQVSVDCQQTSLC